MPNIEKKDNIPSTPSTHHSPIKKKRGNHVPMWSFAGYFNQQLAACCKCLTLWDCFGHVRLIIWLRNHPISDFWSSFSASYSEKKISAATNISFRYSSYGQLRLDSKKYWAILWSLNWLVSVFRVDMKQCTFQDWACLPHMLLHGNHSYFELTLHRDAYRVFINAQ